MAKQSRTVTLIPSKKFQKDYSMPGEVKAIVLEEITPKHLRLQTSNVKPDHVITIQLNEVKHESLADKGDSYWYE